MVLCRILLLVVPALGLLEVELERADLPLRLRLDVRWQTLLHTSAAATVRHVSSLGLQTKLFARKEEAREGRKDNVPS